MTGEILDHGEKRNLEFYQRIPCVLMVQCRGPRGGSTLIHSEPACTPCVAGSLRIPAVLWERGSGFKGHLIMTSATFSLFLLTFFLVSLTPGMCMMLSLSLGMSVGVRRTAWMWAGELIGVGIVAAGSVLGVATVLLQYPPLFTAFKWGGGAYLVWLGIEMWRSRGSLAIPEMADGARPPGRMQLAIQGLVTAIANPKGWAFFIALLPPFLNFDQPMAPQLSLLLAIILSMELCCLILYAMGGSVARRLLASRSNVRLMNRISGALIAGIGIWLMLD